MQQRVLLLVSWAQVEKVRRQLLSSIASPSDKRFNTTIKYYLHATGDLMSDAETINMKQTVST